MIDPDYKFPEKKREKMMEKERERGKRKERKRQKKISINSTPFLVLQEEDAT